MNSTAVPSNKPYLVRALYQWCVDYGFTPYLAVFVTEQVQVPMDYVNNQEIVLNIGPDACQALQMDNEWITFKARFAGVPRDIMVPITQVMAIYAKENGQGMSFPVERQNTPEPTRTADTPAIPSKGKPSLKIVK
ncbi:ClpXP protease specificity-enhancing factor [Polynucleobacter sp. MWH-Loch1C5]|uniref:ClpXP protease specificity-enhancing factor n=1 Tax=Polynucleobacter sp. MWH-Loch1C5 TaxID=2689108 RepID=UPI001C0E350A|nr:ClpXP protease specificity-enhancing factor [Polynucleobacter sp. MWH-Loch1C5]MBU3542336.1 ClpXP protease specificity-enhancing factor [Polynucleobacter sp. MWH-Loch1C5]